MEIVRGDFLRKRNFAFAIDNIFWLVIYLLPILCYLVYLGNASSVDLTFYTFFNDNILALLPDNVFVTSIFGIFGTGGVLPFFNTSSPDVLGVVYFLSYFVLCYFIHFCVDILMLLPRMLMHAMDKFGGGC